MLPDMRIADVDTRPLAGLVRACHGLRVVLLNGLMSLRGPDLEALAAVDRIPGQPGGIQDSLDQGGT